MRKVMPAEMKDFVDDKIEDVVLERLIITVQKFQRSDWSNGVQLNC